MIVEIIQASVGIVYPSRKEDVVKTCNTRRLFEELGCLLPCSVIHWCCVAVHIHTLYTQHTSFPSVSGGEQRFGDNWGFYRKVIKISKNRLTLLARKADSV